MIALYSQGLCEVTALSNYFIDHFMPKANGEFVKVYIYLLRTLGAPQFPLSLSQMADTFSCTEGDILRALKYWEGEKLLSLLYEGNQLSGISLLDPAYSQMQASPHFSMTAPGFQETSAAADQPSQAFSSSYSSQSDPTAYAAPSATQAYKDGQSDALTVGADSKNPAGQPVMATADTKPLTADRVKELKQNDEIVQLLYIAEQYLGKTLTPTETRKILFFYDELHMSVDLIDYLIEYCVGRDHRSIRYIETVAMAWKEAGITTVEMAKESTARYAKEYFSVLKSMGITNRNPVDTEIALINTWMKEYGFTLDLIQEACSRTVLQTGQPSFQYADKILQSWKKKEIRSLEDVRLQDAQHQKRRQEKAAARPAAPKAPNRFNNFHQRDYDFTEYEKKLLNQ